MSRRKSWLPAAGFNGLSRGGAGVDPYSTASILAALAGTGSMVFDPTDKANLFKTDDTSQPVTAVADAVGYNKELLSGWHFLQSNASLRPSYREPDGFGCLQFDGSNDCLGISSGAGLDVFKAIGFGMIVVAAKPTTSASAGRMIHIAIPTIGSSRVSLEKNASDKLNLNGRRLDADTNRTQASTASINDAWAVFTGEFDFANTTMAARINLETAESSSPAWGAGSATSNTSSNSVVMGASRNDNGTTPFLGYIGRVAIIPQSISPALKEQIIRWAGRGAALDFPFDSFDYYVDSEFGSDSNNGQDKATPFKTIAAVSAVMTDGSRIGLKRGSTWLEQLGVDTPAKNNVTVGAYGSGKMPVLDGRDTISGSWTKTVGFTNLYEKTVSVEYAVNETVSVWEDDVRLRWVSSQALADATPGRFYAPVVSGDTITIYVHASDSADPTSNGKTYKNSARGFGLLTGQNWRVSDIHTKCSLHNNGSAQFRQGSIGYRCLFEDGTKHNALIAGDCWLYDCIAWKSDWHDRTNTSGFVAYTDDGRGFSAGFTRCIVVMEEDKIIAAGTGAAIDGFLAHTLNTSQKWDRLSYIDCAVSFASTAISAGYVEDLIVTRPYVINSRVGVTVGGTTNTVLDAALMNPPESNIPMLTGVWINAGTVTIEGLRAYVSRAMDKGVFYAANANCTLIIQKNAMQRASGQSGYCFFHRQTGATSQVTFRQNIIYAPGATAEMAFRAAGDAVLDVDYNVYYPNTVDFQIGSTSYTTFALYRAGQSALDVNSIAGSDPLFTDAANGDFSLQEGSPAIALGAGLERPSVTYTAIPSDVDLAAM